MAHGDSVRARLKTVLSVRRLRWSWDSVREHSPIGMLSRVPGGLVGTVGTFSLFSVIVELLEEMLDTDEEE